jgi:predicted ATPase
MDLNAAAAGNAPMITKLSVSNFKSVRHLDIDCKKVNLFIGEPNTGKSNILEALALLSWCGRHSQPLGDYVRFNLMQYLFYDGLAADRSVEIKISTPAISPTGIRVVLEGDSYDVYPWESKAPFRKISEQGDYEGTRTLGTIREIKFFRFRNLVKHEDNEPGSLKPPNGTNLLSVISGAEALREMVKEFFEKYALKPVVRHHDKTLELQKEIDGWVSTIPYTLASDTLRRIIFYTVAIASNKDSVLVFEEPESNAFPYYTKYLGERIALDETNRFFIATHNPYLLSAVVEKGRKDDVQVFITYFENYETKVKPLTSDQLAELMEADPFFNLDRFIEEGQ